MPRLDKPYLLAVAVLALLVFFPIAMPSSFRMDETKNPLFEIFPKEIGGWSGEDVALEEKVYEILETRNVLSRTYQNEKGESLHLLLVGSERDRRVAHPPEVCYISSHYTITDEAEGQVRAGDAVIPYKEFVAHDERRPGVREKVFYVYKIGDSYTANYYSQQIRFAWQALAQHDTEILLIRLSAPDDRHFQSFLRQVVSLLESPDGYQ